MPLTSDAIFALSGRDLDRAVAECVMGWKKVIGPSHGADWHALPPDVVPWSEKDGTSGWLTIPDYSTSIRDAWLVAEALHLSIVWNDETQQWHAVKWHYDYGNVYEACVDGSTRVNVAATTAPVAICRAALLAVLKGKGE